jgi:glycosyltransferase involved in cell wall biosynthesis
VTIHDLAGFIVPQTFTLKMRLWQRIFVGNAVRVADRILADSGSTKNDILRFYQLDPALIQVVHLPIGEQFKPVSDRVVLDECRRQYGLPPKFILYVGTLEPRKNVAALARAYAQLPAELRNEYSLVLVGASGWFSKGIIEEIDSLKMPDRIRRIGYVDQQNLPALYSLASVFAYLSIYEGFGAPPLEAMACGTPTLSSHSSSLPEAVGNAAALVDPLNVDEISAMLNRLLTDKTMRDQLTKAGLNHVKNFKALDKAREVLKIFEEVVSEDEPTNRKLSSP